MTQPATHPTPADILAACADLSECELFEALEAEGFTPEQVAASAGADIEARYGEWIYMNVK